MSLYIIYLLCIAVLTPIMSNSTLRLINDDGSLKELYLSSYSYNEKIIITSKNNISLNLLCNWRYNPHQVIDLRNTYNNQVSSINKHHLSQGELRTLTPFSDYKEYITESDADLVAWVDSWQHTYKP